MARSLTTKEADAVEQKKLPKRPSFFNDATQQEEQISEAGEVWAILLPDKSKLQKILGNVVTDVHGRSDRTALFTEFVDDMIEALSFRDGCYLDDLQEIDAAEVLLNPQQSTTVGTQMEGVENTFEVALIAEDIRVTRDEIRRKEEETNYLIEWLQYTVKERWVTDGNVNPARRQRISSWMTVLAPYS